MKTYQVQVSDINGTRVETVVGRQIMNSQPILIFHSADWAYASDTKPMPTVAELLCLLSEGAALMPLGTAKRAAWLKKLPATRIVSDEPDANQIAAVMVAKAAKVPVPSSLRRFAHLVKRVRA